MEMNFDTTAINIEDLEGAKSLLKKRFPSLIEGYFEDAEMYLNGIEDGLRDGDLEKVSKSAHPLKSASAGLGLTGVSEIARAIEEGVKLGGTVDTIEPMLAPLKEALDHVYGKLANLMDAA